MSSLVSALRFSLAFQVIIAAAWHFFQWFAWGDDLALVRRSGIGEVNAARLLILFVFTLGWWVYMTALVWQLKRGAALLYFLFLIFLPLANTVGEGARDFPRGPDISGLDVLYYMNGAFILSLTTLTPLRKFFRAAPGNRFFKDVRKAQRWFKIGACGMLFLGIIAQRIHPESHHGTPSGAKRGIEHGVKAKEDETAEQPEHTDAVAPAR